jgi:hypothetical protein
LLAEKSVVKVETQTKEVTTFLEKMAGIRKRFSKVDPRMVYFIER